MKMIYGICCLMALLIGCSEPPKRDCQNFKTGAFSFTTSLEGKTATTLFDRNDSLEIETFQGKKDTSYIRWINDCEYVLRRKNPNSRAEEKAIHIKILTTTDSTYTFEFNSVGDSKKLRGTAIKTQ